MKIRVHTFSTFDNLKYFDCKKRVISIEIKLRITHKIDTYYSTQSFIFLNIRVGLALKESLEGIVPRAQTLYDPLLLDRH